MKTADLDGKYKLFFLRCHKTDVFDEKFKLLFRNFIVKAADFDGEFKLFLSEFTVKTEDLDGIFQLFYVNSL